jgi:hypothetical protein
VNAQARQPRHVDPVVDDDDRSRGPPPAVRGLDRSQEVPVGQAFFPDLEEPDPRVEEPAGDRRDVAGSRRVARADRVDRRRFQGSV